MAARRVRIKGIANIPPRGRNLPQTINETKDEQHAESLEIVDTTSVDSDHGKAQNNEHISQTSEIIASIASVEKKTVSDENKNTQTVSEQGNDLIEKKPQCPPRRRFIKPAISSNVINRNRGTRVDEDEQHHHQQVNEEINENQAPSPLNKINEPNNKIIVQGIITKLPNATQLDGFKSGSDTEYPPPALSPNKFLNRSRIKAVPRLGHQRRTSFSIGSASESEDDSRRINNRIRHDSVCSVVSGITELPPVESASPRRKTEFSSVIQRKCKRTEQSRKLAEARRDFQMRFSNGKPDKQRLTMIDLIFYNPATSPMSQKKKRRLDTETESVPEQEIVEEVAEKESIPDGSDEENTLPAPQITIGANGEIIIDEKSLIIENNETKKSLEALKHSEIVDGDFDMHYGVYKRPKRTKDWSKSETLRFYKALNTIGTDFTLMGELFPDRSRRELKMKFKKEERMNRSLIDRAVMQPIQFDMTELRREVEMDKVEKLEAEKLKRDKEKYKLQKQAHKPAKRKKSTSLNSRMMESDSDEDDIIRKKLARIMNKRPGFVKGGINSMLDDSDSNDSIRTIDECVNKIQQTRSGRISTPIVRNDAAGKIDFNTNEGKETPIKKSAPLKVEKNNIGKMINQNIAAIMNKKSAQLGLTNDNHRIFEKDNVKDISSNGVRDIKEDEKLQPGSLLILSKTGDVGETCYDIFTVSENGEKIPIEVTAEILQNITNQAVNSPDSDAHNSNDSIENVSLITDLNITTQDMSDTMIIPFEEYNAEILEHGCSEVLMADQAV